MATRAQADTSRAVELRCGSCSRQRVLARCVLMPDGRVRISIGRRPLRHQRERRPGVGAPVWNRKGVEEHPVFTLLGVAPLPAWHPYPCEKRCGKQWPRSREQVERAVLKAIEDRRSRIVLGVDL